MQSLASEYINPNPAAPVLVLFGGNPFRRDEIVRLLQPLGLTVYGTLSEAEGMAKVRALPRVDLVLIGGRYTDGQRVRIRQTLAQLYPGLPISEPGLTYAYTNQAIFDDINTKINSLSTQ